MHVYQCDYKISNMFLKKQGLQSYLLFPTAKERPQRQVQGVWFHQISRH